MLLRTVWLIISLISRIDEDEENSTMMPFFDSLLQAATALPPMPKAIISKHQASQWLQVTTEWDKLNTKKNGNRIYSSFIWRLVQVTRKGTRCLGEQPELIMKGFHTFLLSVNYVRKERIMWHLLLCREHESSLSHVCRIMWLYLTVGHEQGIWKHIKACMWVFGKKKLTCWMSFFF